MARARPALPPAESSSSPPKKQKLNDEEEEEGDDEPEILVSSGKTVAELNINRDILCGILPPTLYRKEHQSFELFELQDQIDWDELGNADEGDNKNDDEDNDDNDAYHEAAPKEFYWSELVKQLPDNERVKSLSKQLCHGDSVHFHDYRLCNTFIVYRLKREDEPLLIQTYMEYGYGLPVDFSDAPEDYFGDMYDLLFHFLDPVILWEGTTWFHQITQLIKERRENPSYVGSTDYDYGPQKINLDKFPNDYIFVYEGDASSIGIMEREGSEAPPPEKPRKRYEAKRKMLRDGTLTMTRALFKNMLPEEMIATITSFVV